MKGTAHSVARAAEYMAPCFGACPDLASTLHRELRLLKVVEPNQARIVEVKCLTCHRVHTLQRPPDEEGKRKLHDYRHKKGLGHEH